jgi:hypothetical protein
MKYHNLAGESEAVDATDDETAVGGATRRVREEREQRGLVWSGKRCDLASDWHPIPGVRSL